MAREKATITLDRDKARLAQQLVGAGSTSAAVDAALDCLIRMRQIQNDIAAYSDQPPTDEELVVAAAGAHGDIHDDVDWDALYRDR